jgi:endonuclease III
MKFFIAISLSNDARLDVRLRRTYRTARRLVLEREDCLKKNKPRLASVLDRLEEHYGAQEAVGPSDPYEMVLFINCGYPATDASCSKGYEPLKREIGIKSKEILAAPKEKLARLTRAGGMMPELRAERLKTIARIVSEEFGGKLKWSIEKLMQAEEDEAGKGIRRVKKALKEFPTIGEPGADKILLFAGLAPVAAVPSACTGVPQRILFGSENKNYAAGYRAAQEAMRAELSETFEARQRAYLLLKRHGQEICKRTKPKCEICPVSRMCRYFEEKKTTRGVDC